METIQIPKVNILDLIKTNECQYYENNLYTEITVRVIEGSYTSYDYETSTVNLAVTDLATLLFDRVYFSDSLTLIVV